MLTALERGLNSFNIDFYLVGAVARDLWMTAINDIKPSRITGDIDFAVFINDKGTYESLRQYLIDVEGFHPLRENAFVLIWKGFLQVDLLPFGAIEGKGAQVTVEGAGLTSVSVPGFQEIYDHGLPKAELEEVHHFKFCTLPGIVMLKLLAYQDRPEIRFGDITDISNILKHFFGMYETEIFENHTDLFENNPDLQLLAARVMGREMGKIASPNEALFVRLRDLIEANAADPATSEIGRIMSKYYGSTVEDSVVLLRHILTGFTERLE